MSQVLLRQLQLAIDITDDLMNVKLPTHVSRQSYCCSLVGAAEKNSDIEDDDRSVSVLRQVILPRRVARRPGEADADEPRERHDTLDSISLITLQALVSVSVFVFILKDESSDHGSYCLLALQLFNGANPFKRVSWCEVGSKVHKSRIVSMRYLSTCNPKRRERFLVSPTNVSRIKPSAQQLQYV